MGKQIQNSPVFEVISHFVNIVILKKMPDFPISNHWKSVESRVNIKYAHLPTTNGIEIFPSWLLNLNKISSFILVSKISGKLGTKIYFACRISDGICSYMPKYPLGSWTLKPFPVLLVYHDLLLPRLVCFLDCKALLETWLAASDVFHTRSKGFHTDCRFTGYLLSLHDISTSPMNLLYLPTLTNCVIEMLV